MSLEDLVAAAALGASSSRCRRRQDFGGGVLDLFAGGPHRAGAARWPWPMRWVRSGRQTTSG